MTAPRAPWWKGRRGEWWVVGQTVLIAALAFAPQIGALASPSREWLRILGGLLIAAGIGLAARAMIDLGPNLSPFPQPQEHASLTRSGLYARVRHPIYGGLIVAGLGWALWKGSALHLLLAAVLALYMHAKAAREELHLLTRFPEYGAYRNSTRRMIPWVY